MDDMTIKHISLDTGPFYPQVNVTPSQPGMAQGFSGSGGTVPEMAYPINVLIAGGGTGGHLFPGIAMARAFIKRNPKSRILFAGTDRAFETAIMEKEGFEHRAIRAAGIKNLGLLKKVSALFKIPGALIQSARIISDFKPDVIIGVGGYSSGPVVLAAWMMGKVIVLHEQNILPGITNRVLGRFAKRIHVSFGESLDYFRSPKALITGNPVRQMILDAKNRRQEAKDASNRPFTVLVAGGSQGAHSINTVMVQSLEHLADKNGFRFIHQTGQQDETFVKEAYDRQGVHATVQAFYHDMDKQYEKADLIVCRAGATSIAEITAMGHASILIPFPHAADDHQVKNAMSLVNKGAAEMITEDVLDGKALAQRLMFYRNNPDERLMLAENSECYGKPFAAESIVNDCYALIRGR